MDKSFNSIEELMAYVKRDIAKTIVKKSDVIEDTMLLNIKQNVYDAYDPVTYNRRWENDGLYDRSNIEIKAEAIGNGVDISISNNTMTNGWDEGNYLDEIIEYGTAEEGDNDAPIYAKPRPFIEPTLEDLEEKEIIQKILKNNLDYIK